VRQQAVDALVRGLDAHFAGSREAVGTGSMPTIHTGSSTGLRLQFVEQIGADVARPDQRTFDLSAHSFSPNGLSWGQTKRT
jgi:hypothetical protein